MPQQPHKCGVYAIEQIGTSRFYIGSSSNIAVRWYRHRSALNAGKHHSPFLQKAWTKHGSAAFRFYVLQECLRDELLDLEQEFLDVLQPEFNVHAAAGVAGLVKAQREKAAKIVQCPKGHPYDYRNTHMGSQGKRQCRKCAADWANARIAAETPEQREWRRLRSADYYERNRAVLMAQNTARAAQHKEEKREYDRQLRERQRTNRPVAQPRTQCRAGHPYSSENTRIWGGTRVCWTCRNQNKRQHRSEESAEQREKRLVAMRANYYRRKAS